MPYQNNDFADALPAYIAGESIKSISDRLAITRPTVTSYLKRQGVEIRNASQAGRLIWAVLTPEQRSRQVQAAHEARTGSQATLAEKDRRARTTEERTLGRGVFEAEMEAALSGSGHLVRPQARVGHFNVDLLVDEKVAVELSTAPVHRYNTPEGLDRCRAIAGEGLSLYYLHIRHVEACQARLADILADIRALAAIAAGERKSQAVRCVTYSFERFRDEVGRVAARPKAPEHLLLPVSAPWLP